MSTVVSLPRHVSLILSSRWLLRHMVYIYIKDIRLSAELRSCLTTHGMFDSADGQDHRYVHAHM